MNIETKKREKKTESKVAKAAIAIATLAITIFLGKKKGN